MVSLLRAQVNIAQKFSQLSLEDYSTAYSETLISHCRILSTVKDHRPSFIQINKFVIQVL